MLRQSRNKSAATEQRVCETIRVILDCSALATFTVVSAGARCISTGRVGQHGELSHAMSAGKISAATQELSEITVSPLVSTLLKRRHLKRSLKFFCILISFARML